MSRYRWSLLAGAMALLSACSTSTSGQGSGGSTTGASATTFPATTASVTSVATTTVAATTAPMTAPSNGATGSTSVTSTAATSTAATSAPSTAGSFAPPPGTRTISVRGADNAVYRARVVARDEITDCAAHSYGAPMVAYFRAHPCVRAGRVLAVLGFGTRQVVFSAVTVECAIGPTHDVYKWSAVFDKLENSGGTGSVDDLLRDGARIAGLPRRIPAHEAFTVMGQDNVVSVADLWFLTGTTRDQDPALVGLAQNLFPSALTQP